MNSQDNRQDTKAQGVHSRLGEAAKGWNSMRKGDGEMLGATTEKPSTMRKANRMDDSLQVGSARWPSRSQAQHGGKGARGRRPGSKGGHHLVGDEGSAGTPEYDQPREHK